MKKILFATLLLCLMVIAGMAQAPRGPYHRGHVVVSNHDTLKGFVKGTFQEVWFRPHLQKGEKTKFGWKSVVGYLVEDHIYESNCVEVLQASFPERVCGFLRVLEKGPVTLLMYKGDNLYTDTKHENYYVQKTNGPLIRVRKEKRAFRSDMSHFFHQHPGLRDSIKAKVMGYEDIWDIVHEYNNWAKENLILEEPKEETEEVSMFPWQSKKDKAKTEEDGAEEEGEENEEEQKEESVAEEKPAKEKPKKEKKTKKKKKKDTEE